MLQTEVFPSEVPTSDKAREACGHRRDATDNVMKRPIFGMSPGLTKNAVALPPSTADVTSVDVMD